MDTVKKMFETTSIGSVLFPHRVLLFYPLLAPLPFEFNAVNYDGIHMTVYKDISGPPKVGTALFSMYRKRLWFAVAAVYRPWARLTVE